MLPLYTRLINTYLYIISDTKMQVASSKKVSVLVSLLAYRCSVSVVKAVDLKGTYMIKVNFGVFIPLSNE